LISVGSIVVMDIFGRSVRTLSSQGSSNISGQLELVWDGKNDEGLAVANGIYLFSLTSDKDIYTELLVIQR
jgi:flagellar hook assembly protein FlgD